MDPASQIGGRSGNPFTPPSGQTRPARASPLDGLRPPMLTGRAMTSPAPMPLGDRLRLYWWKDHGWLRGPWTNFHRLDAEVWRHNHPSPARLARLQALGAASVLSLRGATGAPSRIEARACADLGLPLRTLEMRAHALPRPEALLALLAALREMPKPLVIHCKSGSDRTGLAAAIYLHALRGVPLAQARRQLSWRYVHNPLGPARVLNRLLDAYAEAHHTSGIGFEDWVREGYDPAALTG